MIGQIKRNLAALQNVLQCGQKSFMVWVQGGRERGRRKRKGGWGRRGEERGRRGCQRREERGRWSWKGKREREKEVQDAQCSSQDATGSRFSEIQIQGEKKGKQTYLLIFKIGLLPRLITTGVSNGVGFAYVCFNGVQLQLRYVRVSQNMWG